MTPSFPLPKLPSRASDSHKGSFGTAVLIGGSRGMSGAITLSGQAALRGGCGLTFIACPEQIWPMVAAAEPSFLTIPLPDDSGVLRADAFDVSADWLQKADAVGIGPGLGQGPGQQKLVSELYSKLTQPLVIDADGLNNLASQLASLSAPAGPRVLTPHPGEMSRLTGKTTEEIQLNREAVAMEFAKAHSCIVVLKGAQTIVTDGAEVFVNMTGNNGLGTGGTGDVLTGLLTSLLAQGMSPLHAAHMAVHVHGHAGDLAAEQLGVRGLIASDLPHYVALALKELE